MAVTWGRVGGWQGDVEGKVTNLTLSVLFEDQFAFIEVTLVLPPTPILAALWGEVMRRRSI